MNTMRLFVCLVLALILIPGLPAEANPPSLINYQGRLLDGTNLASGAYSVVFRLYASGSGGTALYVETQTVEAVDGLYAAHIGASNAAPGVLAAALGADPCYLEVEIGGQVLSPRERMVSAPYALIAAGTPEGAITGIMLADEAVSGAKLAPAAVTADKIDAGAVGQDQLATDSVTGGKIDDGTITSADVAANTFWQTGGNAGTTAGTHFVGTTDDQPLELRTHNRRALRLETDGGTAVNVIGGGWDNVVSNGVTGATVFGGGASGGWAPPNLVGAPFGAVGGGTDNKAVGSYSVVAGGRGNTAANNASAIGGGSGNSTFNSHATIGGGEGNQAGWYAAVAGGRNNSADYDGAVGGGEGNRATYHGAVPGGFGNLAENGYSIAAGGYSNVADASYAFAAGRRAKARHSGAFVWADSTDTNFDSTAANQFLIRAGGGVGIGTNVTPAMLTVAGNIHSYGFRVEETTNAPNIVAGHPSNSCAPGVVGSVIAGGGYVIGITTTVAPNRIEQISSVIGGGYYNAILGGDWGGADTIAGGYTNTIRGSHAGASVGGGLHNEVWNNCRAAVIGGGEENIVSNGAWHATIGGGYFNRASGEAATVPGGQQNLAQGKYSMACGLVAEALHNGCFVWNDSRGWPPFTTTADNQFLVQAGGGVGIGTNVTPERLTVAGNVQADNFLGGGTNLTGVNADRVDGYHASNASGAVPVNNGVLNTNLNADMLDGVHGSGFLQIRASGVVQAGSTNISIPRWTPFTLWLSSGHPAIGGLAHVEGCENDSAVAIVYTKYNGDGTSASGGSEGTLASSTLLLFFGNSSYTNEVRCPGDGSRTLLLTHSGTAEMLYRLVY